MTRYLLFRIIIDHSLPCVCVCVCVRAWFVNLPVKVCRWNEVNTCYQAYSDECRQRLVLLILCITSTNSLTWHVTHKTSQSYVSDFVPFAQLTISTSGLYRWAKFSCNSGCYACRVLSSLRNTHDGSQAIMWKYDVIHKTGSRTPSDEDRAKTTGNMHNIWWSSAVCFRVMWADRHTLTNR